MWVFPFLHYKHQYPLTTFDQEWWSALLGLLALSLLLSRDYWPRMEMPRIVQLPAALMMLALLQAALGLMASFDQALLYLLYLLFALLLMLLGARLREALGLEMLALVLASCLLTGAETSALIGVLQHYHLHTPLDPVTVSQISSDVYGNLAQRNHYANYISIGLISLGFLSYRRNIPALMTMLLALPLLFVMTLSGSRSSWLYLLMICLLSGWAAWRKRELKPLMHYSALLLAGFAAMQFLVQLPFLNGTSHSINTLQRFTPEMSGADATGGIRLYIWHEAWLIFTAHPWLGAGFGQFAWQHFQLGPILHRTIVTGLFNNAHNLLFQLAAETGLAGLLALFVSLAIWLNGLRRAAWSAAHWWGYAVLGVLTIHSLLEYPLWYAYFLAIAAVLLGALDETRYRLLAGQSSRIALALLLVMAGFALFQLRTGYQQLKDTLTLRQASGISIATLEHNKLIGLQAVRQVSLWTPYADMYLSHRAVVSDIQLADKLALNSRVVRFMPIASTTYKQAFLLAQNGQLAQAELCYEQALWSYPGDAQGYAELVKLAEKDPAHFSALLEFALQKEQEYASAIHHR